MALIGANGAGKTTTLHTITGLISAKTGKIVYEGTDITRVSGYKLVGMGIAHVPEMCIRDSQKTQQRVVTMTTLLFIGAPGGRTF